MAFIHRETDSDTLQRVPPSSPFRFETSPSDSLNRVQIIYLPGLHLDEEVRCKREDELVSNRVLMTLFEHEGLCPVTLDGIHSDPSIPQILLSPLRRSRTVQSGAWT